MKSKLLFCATLAALAGGTTAAGAQVSLELIAGYQLPAPVPGLPAAAFSRVGLPRVDTSGQLALHTGIVGGTTSANDDVLWVGRPGNLQIAAREGNAAPGTSGGTVLGDFYYRVAVNPQQVGFLGRLTGPLVNSSNDTGLWAGTPGNLTLVARDGDPAAGLPGVQYVHLFDYLSMHSSGSLLWGASLSGEGVNPDNDNAHWYGPPSAPQLLLREDDPAPGISGARFSSVGFGPPGRNGHLVLLGRLRGSVAVDADTGIWHGTPGSFTLLAREGSPAPGTPAGVVFEQLQNPARVNANGRAAFHAELRGPGINTTNSGGTWFGSPGAVELVVRQGNEAPGTGGALFGRNHTFKIQVNDSDQVLFEHFLQGPGVTSTNDESIWLASGGDLRLIAREGDPAPGTGGALFGTFIDSFPGLSHTGQVSFQAQLTGPGVTPDNNQALWASDPAGNLHLVVREGTPFELFPGFVRNVSDIATSGIGWEGALEPHWSDAGELAFNLQFGLPPVSSAFIAIVPEPASAMLAAGVLLTLRRPRRPRA